MWERIVSPEGLVVVGIGAVVAFLIGLFGGLGINKEDHGAWNGGDSALRGLEAFLLAAIGAMLARLVTSVLCGLADDQVWSNHIVGWFLFMWPGVVDLVAWIVEVAGGNDSRWRMSHPDNLLWWATAVGLLAGTFDGTWRTHKWKGPGWITFPADVTWGLANTTNAQLLHLVNFAWAGHRRDPRNGAHRYDRGFRFLPTYAFTQGNTMSNMGSSGPSSALWKHENTHILQNRIFGGIFTLTYVGWIILWLIPALIVAAARKDIMVVQDWTYMNNPWEGWAYHVGHKHGASPRTAYGNHVWKDGWVVLCAALFFIGIAALLTLAIMYWWIGITW